MRNYVILILIIILTSCASGPSKREIHDSWLGAHKSRLIQSWGPPSRSVSDGQGGEILIYERSNTSGTIIYGNYYQNTVVIYSDMFANGEGIIYYYRYGQR